MTKKLFLIVALSLFTLAVAAPTEAQHRARGGAAVRGSAGARGGVAVAPPRVVAPSYRPYYSYPRYSFGFYSGYPYFSPYYYPYGYYGYGGYGYGLGYGAPYGYGYGGGYYVNRDEVRGLGGVQIKDAPKDAQVFADGYYAGTVDDFDGAFQHLDLEAGAHHIEIREQGRPAISFDVNVRPGDTITYHAR